jgi:long-chain acyl-CoA synthetase
MITRQEAITELTGKGMPLELQTVEVHGNPLRVFKNAPDSLRDVWQIAAQQGQATYFIYEDIALSYAEAHRQVVSVAAWLTSQGVKKGDRVALGMRNYPEWAIAYWATQCIGAVMVSLNAWWIADELKYALSDSGASAVIVDGERQDRIGWWCGFGERCG